MPYLKITTNNTIDESRQPALLSALSEQLASDLGKSEQYIMLELQQNCPMMFAGSKAPTAFLELKSIGLAPQQTSALSQSLCQTINRELGIDQDRVYIEFSDAPRQMWGWNGKTF